MFGLSKSGKLVTGGSTVKVELDGKIPNTEVAKLWVTSIPKPVGIEVTNVVPSNDKIFFDLKCEDPEKCSIDEIRHMIDTYRMNHQEPFYLTDIKLR